MKRPEEKSKGSKMKRERPWRAWKLVLSAINGCTNELNDLLQKL